MTRTLFALALALPGVALANGVPEKCKHLDVKAYNLEWIQSGKTLAVDALIRNEDQYRLQWATFGFNFYTGGNNQVGQGTGSISNLEPGDEVHLKMPTMLTQIDNIGIWSVTCTFVQ